MALRNSYPKYSRFRFDAGSLSLNFAATVRHRGAQPRDLLTMPEMLKKWFHLSGLEVFEISLIEFRDAILLREAIHDAVRSIILGKKPNGSDVEIINRAAEFPIAVPQFHPGFDRVVWETKHPLKACLAVIARDAITLMGGSDRLRLKMCGSGSCRMLFVDQSPANRRRWCAMSICGNREKIRVHRQRKQSPS
ncbi:MAG: CGNR zinc finger domain-containing protein [Syntrophales bacterium]|nr:CGNR zinc finger domain-containing protein [Syntrophales bacterium]